MKYYISKKLKVKLTNKILYWTGFRWSRERTEAMYFSTVIEVHRHTQVKNLQGVSVDEFEE